MKLLSKFLFLALMIKSFITLETIYISHNSLCQFSCNGSNPQNAIKNFFMALHYIESRYSINENFDFEIILFDPIHILDENSLNFFDNYYFNQSLETFIFFAGFQNLNLTIKSNENNKSKLFIRTHNFTIFVGKFLRILDIDFYGNDMVFFENNHQKNLNSVCVSEESLCCENSDIFSQFSELCGFLNKKLFSKISDNLAMFIVNENIVFNLIFVNVSLNNYLAFSGDKIKYASFIKIKSVNEINVYLENVRSDNCFFSKSILNIEEINNSIYYINNLTISNYNSLNLLDFINESFLSSSFFKINRSNNVTFKNLFIDNSQNLFYFNNSQNVFISDLSFINMNMNENEFLNIIYIDCNSSIIMKFVKFSNLIFIKDEIKERSINYSFIVINQYNKITLNLFEIFNVIFSNNTDFIHIFGQNNSISIDYFDMNDLMGNGTLIYSNEKFNSFEITNIYALNISLILFDINISSIFSFSFSYIQSLSNKFSNYLLYFGQNNHIYFNSCIFSNEKIINEEEKKVGGSSLIQINDNNFLYLNKTDFKHFYLTKIGILEITSQNKVYLTEIILLKNSGSLFGNICIHRDNFIEIKNVILNGSIGGVFSVDGYNNFIEIDHSIFVDNIALTNATIGTFKNLNNISFIACTFITKESNLNSHAIYASSLIIFKMKSCVIYSGPIHFLKGSFVRSIIFENITIIKAAGYSFLEFDLDNIEFFVLKNSLIMGELKEGNIYFPIFVLFEISNLLIDFCIFRDFNILNYKLGTFSSKKNMIITNSRFENMCSWSYDYGYLFQNLYFNSNSKIFNCSFSNMTSTNKSDLLVFFSNAFLEISQCVFTNTNSLNLLQLDPLFAMGAAIVNSQFNNYVVIQENKFISGIKKNSLWGLFFFYYSASISVNNNIFLMNNTLPGSIFQMNFYQETNYSYFFLDSFNSLFIKNLTFFFAEQISGQNREYSGFLLYANSENNILIEDIIFINDDKRKLGIFALIFLQTDNIISLLNCYFNNAFVSPLLFSISLNKIYINKTILLNFYGGIIASDNKNEILLKSTNISFFMSQKLSIFDLNFLNNLILIESSVKNSESTYLSIINGYDSNKIYLSNSSFENFKNNGNGGVICISMNNQIYIFNIIGQNLRAFAGGFGYLENNNKLSISYSSLNNIASFSYGGSFKLLADNSIKISDCIINNTVSSNFAGFLISYSQNSIKLFSSFFNNSEALLNSGGLIYLIFNSSLQISSCVFQNIHAKKESGGFLKVDNVNIILIRNSSFTNTSALKGGLIFLESSNLLIFLSVLGQNSQAYLYGGNINCNYLNEIKLINSSFDLSFAGLDGGFVYSTSKNFIEMKNVELNNSSSIDGLGGGIYLDYQNFIILDQNKFINLYSAFQGSFLFLRSNNWINVTNSSIENSGIYAKSSSNYLRTSVIEAKINNVLILENITISGDLSCGFIFYINQSKIQIKYINVSHSEKYIISFIFLENCSLNAIAMKIFNDYSILCYSGSSDINISQIQKSSSNLKRSNESHFIFVNSFVYMKSFHYHSFQKNSIFSVQIIYSINSSLSLNRINIKEVWNQFPIKLFEIINSNFSVKNSFFAFNQQITSLNSSNFDISFLSKSQKNFICVIKNTIFLGNSASKFSSALNFILNSINIQIKLQISEDKFVFNTGNLGGALFLSNITNSTIKRTFFSNNRAEFSLDENKGKGGAIYCILQSPIQSILLLETNLFYSNRAPIGGAIYINDPFNQFKSISNQFISNQAHLYGNDQSSDIHRLSFINEDSIFLIDDLPRKITVISGYNYSIDLLKIGAFDKFDNFLVKTDENFLQRITILQEDNTSLTNLFFFVQKEGYLALTGYFKRNELPILSSFNYIVKFDNFNISSQLRFILEFKTCDFGERLSENLECIVCPINTYIFESDFSTTSEACKSCISKPFNCYGGDLIVPKTGYWRFNNKSSNFMQCFIEFNCLGDNNTLNSSNYLDLFTEEMKTGICQTGYKGPLCSVCAEEYGKIDKFFCRKCIDQGYSAVLIISTLIRVSFVLASVYYATQKCNAISRNSQNSINKVFKSNLLKILTNHMQVLMIISSFPFEWPSEITFFLGYFFSISPNVAEGFSLECFIKNHHYNINHNYLKLEFIAVYPIILLLISLIILKTIKKCKNYYKSFTNKKNEFKNKNSRLQSIVNKNQKINISFLMKIICVFAIILYSCYQDILKVILQMFSCLEVGDPSGEQLSEKRLLIDLSINCNSDSHKKILYFFV